MSRMFADDEKHYNLIKAIDVKRYRRHDDDAMKITELNRNAKRKSSFPKNDLIWSVNVETKIGRYNIFHWKSFIVYDATK